MKALFFAEGGPDVGLGHLRRSTALAAGFARRGWDVRFVAQAEAARGWLQERGVRLERASASGGRLPEADYRCDLFSLDSYLVSNEEVAARVRSKTDIVLAFDDYMNRHSIADVLLNAGVLAPSMPWPQAPVERLLGPDFVPLSPEYLPLGSKREIAEDVRRVLVTVGGTASGLLSRIAGVIRRVLPEAAVDCVVGTFSRDETLPLRARAVRAPGSLKALIEACDLAVSAAGQTLFELAATGTPAIGLSLADNQTSNLAGMERAGCLISAGSVSVNGFESALSQALEKARDRSTRASLSAAGRRLVDGRGAERIERAIRARLAERGATR